MVEVLEPKVLDKLDLKALRTCDTVIFRLENRKCVIECVKEIKNDPWGSQKAHIINTRYKEQIFNTGGNPHEIRHGFYYLGCAEFHEEWQTISHLLKVGDILAVEWMADNNTDVHRKHELHADEVKLEVCRNEKRMLFSIGYQVGYDNSARMIKLQEKVYKEV